VDAESRSDTHPRSGLKVLEQAQEGVCLSKAEQVGLL
jgi:hypothetical protein